MSLLDRAGTDVPSLLCHGIFMAIKTEAQLQVQVVLQMFDNVVVPADKAKYSITLHT